MRNAARLLFTLAFFFVLALAGVTRVSAEEQIAGSTSQDSQPVQDRTTREIIRKQGIARNKERQEDLKKDTDKLLQLATELKLYVDKTNENLLSLDVIKKAEQIEKLSKEIQKKMRAQ